MSSDQKNKNITERESNITSNTTEENEDYEKLLLLHKYIRKRIENEDSEEKSKTISDIEKTHTIFANNRFKHYIKMSHNYVRVHNSLYLEKQEQKLGVEYEFDIPEECRDFINDMTLHLRLNDLESSDLSNKVRYVSMLGHKIIESVSLYINDHLVDVYSNDEYYLYYKNELKCEAKEEYLKNIGQEIPVLGTINYNLKASEDEDGIEIQEYKWFANGNQTFKRKHGNVDLFIPLLFWFRDTQYAFPCFIVNSTIRIKIAISCSNQIVNCSKHGSFYREPILSICDLYVKCLYIDPLVKDIYKNNTRSLIIKSHIRKEMVLERKEDIITLTPLPFPIETMYIIFKPLNNLRYDQHWYKYCMLEKLDIKSIYINKLNDFVIGNVETFEEKSIVDRLYVKHGNTNIVYYDSLFPHYTDVQESKYMVSNNLNCFIVDFRIKSDSNQPSGVFAQQENITIDYSIKEVNNNKVLFLIILNVVNFLFVEDGVIEFPNVISDFLYDK
jgi:hypothetical protein